MLRSSISKSLFNDRHLSVEVRQWWGQLQKEQ